LRRHTENIRGTFLAKTSALVGAFALVAGVMVVGLSSGPSIASGAAVAPLCTTANLDVWLNTTGNGAAGSSYYSLNFTNLSAHTCTLYGYPGVSGVTQAGIQLGSSASRDATHAATVITLTSARTARAFEGSTSHNTATVILQITEAENFPTAMCRPITAAGLRVYPPGQKESTVVPFPFVACATSGPRYLHVESVQKFTSAQ
jgi:hypothetical protein